MAFSTGVQTIVKCKVQTNSKLLTIVGCTGSGNKAEIIGKTFTATKLKNFNVGDTVYAKVVVNPKRIHTLKIEVEPNFGTLKEQFDANQSVEEIESVEEIGPKVVTGEEKVLEDYFFVDDEVAEIFGAVSNSLQHHPELAQKILVVGESGYGKTSIAQRFAEKAKMDCIRMNCATIRDPEEWFGYREVIDGDIVFTPSAFINAVTKGNCVVIFDEINRIESWLTNTLFPLLDHDQKTVVYNQEFKVGPNVLFVGTANIGFKFSGTFAIDEAIKNRFDYVAKISPMPKKHEMKVLVSRIGIDFDEADQIVSIANQIRAKEDLDVTFSTRETLQVARALKSGLSIRSALQHTIISSSHIEGNQKVFKELTDLVNSTHGTWSAESKMKFDFN